MACPGLLLEEVGLAFSQGCIPIELGNRWGCTSIRMELTADFIQRTDYALITRRGMDHNAATNTLQAQS